jgi:hypothetical protein
MPRSYTVTRFSAPTRCALAVGHATQAEVPLAASTEDIPAISAAEARDLHAELNALTDLVRAANATAADIGTPGRPFPGR